MVAKYLGGAVKLRNFLTLTCYRLVAYEVDRWEKYNY